LINSLGKGQPEVDQKGYQSALEKKNLSIELHSDGWFNF